MPDGTHPATPAIDELPRLTDREALARDIYVRTSTCHSLARLLFAVIEPIEDDIVGNPEVDPISRGHITHVRRLTLGLAEQLQQLENQAADLEEVSHG